MLSAARVQDTSRQGDQDGTQAPILSYCNVLSICTTLLTESTYCIYKYIIIRVSHQSSDARYGRTRCL